MEKQISGTGGGFTLIELLVVMGIISILAGLIITVIPTDKGNKIKCMNNLRNIGLAVFQYCSDYGKYPWTEDPEPCAKFQLLVDAGLIDEPKLFICPSCLQQEADYNGGKFKLAPGNVSYAYAAEPIPLSAPSRTIIAADSHWYGEDGEGHRDSIMVLRKSGAVEELKLAPGDTWEKVTENRLSR